MRIKCAKCEAVHDYSLTGSFGEGSDTVVKDPNGFVSMYYKGDCSVFVCKSCGVSNYLTMEWFVIKKAEEELKKVDEIVEEVAEHVGDPEYYCQKCGWHFITHNDDGSCVEED